MSKKPRPPTPEEIAQQRAGYARSAARGGPRQARIVRGGSGTATGRWSARDALGRALDTLARMPAPERPRGRDPERIVPLLALLQQAWLAHPDLRFGQLVSILDGLRLSGADAFNAEDPEWLDALKRFEGCR